MAHHTHLLEIIDKLDAVENDERSVLDDDGVAALIELSDSRDAIRELITQAQQPFLALTAQNRQLVLREAARTWDARCSELKLRTGTKGRQHELEAYLQGVLAVATATRLLGEIAASQVALLVSTGRAEDVVARWGAYRTEAEAAEGVRKLTAVAGQPLA